MSIEIANVIHASCNFITYASAAAPLLSPKGSGFRQVTRISTGLFHLFLQVPLPPWNDGSGLEAPNCHVLTTIGGAWKSLSAQLSADGTYVALTTRQNTDGAVTDFNEIIPVTVLLYPTLN